MKWLESNGIRFEHDAEGSMQSCMREEELKGHSAVIFAINKLVCFANTLHVLSFRSRPH